MRRNVIDYSFHQDVLGYLTWVSLAAFDILGEKALQKPEHLTWEPDW